MKASEAISSGTKTPRWYRRGDSKHRMKLSRYATSGRIQRNGIAATSWVRCVVTASRRIDADAERPSQSSREIHVGASPGALASMSVPEAAAPTAPEVRHAVKPQSTAKHANAPDQIAAWACDGRFGSMTNG